MFKDEQRSSVWDKIRQSDLTVFAAVLTPQVLAEAARRAGVALGAGALNLPTLAWLAVSAALRPGVSFALVLTVTFRLLSDMQRLPRPHPRARGHRRGRRSKHDPRKRPGVPPTEEAFAQARAVMPQKYWVALILLLGELFEANHGRRLMWNGYRLLALDGTCVTLPRHKALGEHFGYASNGGGNPHPQARMVLLLLATARVPWRYELTPHSQGEATVAARLLAELRRDDLVLMDRGFFNYGLFRQLQDAGAFFAIRRTKRLRFRTLRTLSKDERVVRWKPAARRWKGGSIELRVVDYQVKGFRRGAIVTNLLDEQRVSRQQLIGLEGSQAWVTEHDAGLYHRRWQIETAFREIKRVQRMYHGLRGRTPRAIEYEVAGHVVLYLLVRWLIVQAADEAGADPLLLSFTAALREVEHVIRLLPLCAAAHQRQLVRAMLKRMAEQVVPLRPGRHYPRPGDRKIRRTGAGHKILPARLVNG